MIRVLHSVSNMDRGGIETMLMNYYRHIDREKVQFDFIVNKQKPGDYDDEIRRLGGHIYQSPGLNPLHYPAYLRFVQQTVAADPRIRILHAHNEAMGLYALKGAEKAGLQVRIAHAHNIWIVRDYKWPLKMFCKQLLPGAATHLWACGRDAGIYYFGKADWERRGQIIPNAIEPETFRFSPAVRAEMRARYGLEDRVEFLCADVFDLLPQLEQQGEQFDVVILDPPAFTKSRRTIHNAMTGYKEINYRAMKLLPRGGYLATASCSHFATEELFIKMLKAAAKDAHRQLRQIEVKQQAPDHPILWGVPETNYLKFFLFQVI